MIIQKTVIDKLLILEFPYFHDNRGGFQKIFNYDDFLKTKLDSDFKEYYFSVSNKNVIRGMHFQIPPFDHTKVVSVSSGHILDVVLDLREKSPTFGNYFSIELDGKSGKAIYIPSGLAHGFVSLENNTIVNYLQTSCYSNEHDSGILYNSFGFKWPITNPVISERDKKFMDFKSFKGIFK